MSVLVVSRALPPDSNVRDERVPVGSLRRNQSYVSALEYWGAPDPNSWEALAAYDGRDWDAFVNDAIARPDARRNFVSILAGLCTACEELENGELEPNARYRRPS